MDEERCLTVKSTFPTRPNAIKEGKGDLSENNFFYEFLSEKDYI